MILSLFLLAIAASGCVSQTAAPAGNKSAGDWDERTKLVYAVHWMDETQLNGTFYGNGTMKSKGLRSYLREYEMLHPGITFEIQQIVYPEYDSTLRILHDVDNVPDIFQVYSTWGVTHESLGMIDEPPQDVKDDVLRNYKSVAGVTIDGDVWGIPTEVNAFALIYNKKLFRGAGIVDSAGEAKPPVTWDELIADAVKLTKSNNTDITQYGYAFSQGLDWGVVDPFLSLLTSNGGTYISADYKHCMVNSTEGVQALEKIIELFDKDATDPYGNVLNGFAEGRVAMIIMPPWVEGFFRDAFTKRGADFDDEVGVAPVPYMKTPGTLQYNWFMGVMEKSRHKEEAWDFLRWFTMEVRPETGTTRYGDLMVDPIGAIPSRLIDLENHADKLNSAFKKTFVEELDNSVPEPNIMQASEIKNILMGEIQKAWVKDLTAEQALDSACDQIDNILLKYY